MKYKCKKCGNKEFILSTTSDRLISLHINGNTNVIEDEQSFFPDEEYKVRCSKCRVIEKNWEW